jgi:glucose-1-phosphate adenylyltransferase
MPGAVGEYIQGQLSARVALGRLFRDIANIVGDAGKSAQPRIATELLFGLLQHQFIIPVPAQMRAPGETWYRGTADAVYQNLNLIEQSRPDLVVLFGADHIYRMDIRQMIRFHHAKNAGVTVAVIPVDKKFASDFGVIEVDDSGRIISFIEKRSDAPTMPGDPSRVLASMGNYIFDRDVLIDMVNRDAADASSDHDFGKDILPKLIGKVDMYAYDFESNRIEGDAEKISPYWRDVGTLDAYFEANMDVRAIDPPLNLYNRKWPLRTAGYSDPPAKFIFDDENRRGQAHDSLLSGGCIISGGTVKRSVLGRWVRVHSHALRVFRSRHVSPPRCPPPSPHLLGIARTADGARWFVPPSPSRFALRC